MTKIWGGDNFNLSPSITSIDPSVAYIGDTITITGTAFQPTQGNSTVTICGNEASVISWSNTAIMCQIPQVTSSGDCPVTVTVAGQSSTSSIGIKRGSILRFVDYEHSLSGGTTPGILLDINDGTSFCLVKIEYPVPEPRVEWRDPAHGDGRDVSYYKWENREVTITLHIYGANEADLSSNVCALWEQLLVSNPVLEWRADGWADPVYFDVISPPLNIETPDWFETWIRENNRICVMSNVKIVLEAKPFLRGPEETVTLLEGSTSPAVPNGVVGIVVPPTKFKGDVPAPADIFIDLVGGELWTDVIFGQRLNYSDDFNPIQEPTAGAQSFNVNRLNGDYRVIPALTNLVANPSFETITGGSGNTTNWQDWDEFRGGTGGHILQTQTTEYYSDGGNKCPQVGALSSGNVNESLKTADMIPVTATDLYQVGFYGKRAGKGSGLINTYFNIYLYDASETELVKLTVLVDDLSPNWNYYGTYFRPYECHPDTAYIKLELLCGGSIYFGDGYFYWDAVSLFQLTSDSIDAVFPIDSHEGRYLPCAALSFGDTNSHDDVTFDAIIQTAAGEPITTSMSSETIDLEDPNTEFREIALLDNRLPVITLPSHRISSFADKSNLVQVIRLSTNTLNTEDLWYDYLGLIPIDRSYIEVRNWYGNEHLILDSRSSKLALSSLTGSLEDAMVWDITQQKGECNFVADPNGFNGAMLCLTNGATDSPPASKDDRVNAIVNVTMKYSPLYLLVPEE